MTVSRLPASALDRVPASRSEADGFIWASFRRHSRTFSLAAQLLPPSVQVPVATVYLFCRHVDSIADRRVLDVGPQLALKELEVVEQKLEAAFAQDLLTEELLWRRLAEVRAAYGLPIKPFYELINGAVWDLERRPIETLDDLVAYSNLVGGSVGAMMLPFLTAEHRHGELEEAARQLGIAMQITNIVRDVGEDLQQLDRLYLPDRWMVELGVDPEDLQAGRVEEGYVALLERLIAAAEIRYRKGFRGIDALPLRVRIGIRAAARMYREVLNEVRANGYDNLSRRAYVSFRRKVLAAALDGYAGRKANLTA